MKCQNEFEKKYEKLGYQYIIGIDEAGRGPLAGPLVVAGVCFPLGYDSDVIYDSKKISEKKREKLLQIIKEDALFYYIDVVDVNVIDKLNIYQATKQSMMNVAKKFKDCEVVLSDAMPFEMEGLVVEPIIKGDQKSVSIAAASILAKVTRDCIMHSYDKEFPKYGFAKHKGYPTKMHLEMLDRYGVLDIHRRSYAPVSKKLANNKEKR